MENRNITYGANMYADLNEAPVMATNERSEMVDTTVSEKKTRKPRRSAREIKAEYEKFKALLDERRPILEICRLLEIRKSQADSYLTKILLDKHDQVQSYAVCEGHLVPECIRNMVGGTRKDLFKVELSEKGAFVTVLMSQD